ncbi:MAG: EF-hand domain-containing protein [Pseudomonadota bacterium]|nr:EF-hand domain-containing protein [Pseudomonadota bacterium]
MKKTIASLALAGIVLACGPVLAETGMDGGKGRTGGEHFSKMDTNGDGFLSRQEMVTAHTRKASEMFTKMDANKDGKVSREEIAGARKKMKDEGYQHRGEKKHRFQSETE